MQQQVLLLCSLYFVSLSFLNIVLIISLHMFLFLSSRPPSSAFETASEPDTPPPTFPASEQRQQAAARAEEAAEAAEPRPPAQSQTSPTTSPMRQSKLDAEALRARWLLRQAAFKERQAAKAVAAEKRVTSIAPSHVDVGASLLLAGLSDDLTDSHVRAFMLTF